MTEKVFTFFSKKWILDLGQKISQVLNHHNYYDDSWGTGGILNSTLASWKEM